MYIGESDWEAIKMTKAAEKEAANTVVLTFQENLRFLDNHLREIEHLPKGEYNNYMRQVIQEDMCHLTAYRRT